MGCPHHRQVLRIINWRIIDGPSVSSLGPPCCRWAPASSCGLVFAPASLLACVVRAKTKRQMKRATTFVIARFRDAPPGSPTSWVSPWFLVPSHIRPLTVRAHIPQERGGAPVALRSVVGAEVRRRGRGGREGMNQHQPHQRLMSDSNSAPTVSHCARS